MKKIYLTLSLIAFAGSLTCAGSNCNTLQTIAFIQKDTLTPEMKAQKHADYMQQQLNLTADQKKKVYGLTLNKVNKMAALKTKYKSDMNAAQTEIKPVQSKYNEDLKAVLTDDQYKQWLNTLEAKKVKNREPSEINQYDPTILDSQW